MGNQMTDLNTAKINSLVQDVQQLRMCFDGFAVMQEVIEVIEARLKALEDLENYRQQDEDVERALAPLAQPEPQTSKKELTDEQLLKCFKIATPCYNMEDWRRELDGMRAAIAADRALRAELRGQEDSND